MHCGNRQAMLRVDEDFLILHSTVFLYFMVQDRGAYFILLNSTKKFKNYYFILNLIILISTI
jgi:hypothetical protein